MSKKSLKNPRSLKAAQKAPDARPQGLRRPQRTQKVREDLRGTGNKSEHPAPPARARGFGGHVRTSFLVGRSGPPIPTAGLFQQPSKELFLEIGTEELPASFLGPALLQLRESAERLFSNYRIAFSQIKTLGTPRRLVLWCKDLASHQADLEEEILGPAKKIAYDPNGNPTPAALGFARAQGVSERDLSVKSTGKGEYLCIKRKEKGQKTFPFLKRLLPDLIISLSFPKTMRWNGEGIRFARPIRWIVALYDRQLVPFSVAGVQAGYSSRGHLVLTLRGQAKPASFKVKGFDDYLEQARKAHVIVDPEERKEKIREEIERLVQKGGGCIIPDEELLDLTVNMVEFPVAVMGEFERGYLNLPREVLVNAMREHQGYFLMVDQKGRLLPRFISICNIKVPRMDLIRRGQERVLRARLADAKFFFETDRQRGLEGRVGELRGMIFQEGLGSLYEKTERLIALGKFFASQWVNAPKEKVQRAAFLSKADLRTGMVGEFPKLQGIMGGEYALHQGEDSEVSQAIAEQYLPRFVGDKLPETETGIVLAIADKLDTLAGLFGQKRAPTGSQDPYGLRRHALGIIQILLGRQKRLSLRESVTEAVRLYKGQLKRSSEELCEELLDFLKQRLSYLLIQEGHRPDFVDAVLIRCEDPVDARERLIALTDLARQTGFNELIVAFKRVMNILPSDFEGDIRGNMLQQESERELYRHYQSVSTRILPMMNLPAGQAGASRYQETLREMVSLKPLIDQFFDRVLVMDPDPTVRQNRLGLLKVLRDLFGSFADFSKIQEGESKKE